MNVLGFYVDDTLFLSLISGLIGSIIGVFGAFIIARWESGIALSKEKLSKLYSPLYLFIRNSEILQAPKGEIYYLDEDEKKFDSIILNYSHLADSELRELLIPFYGINKHTEKGVDKERMIELIKTGYFKYNKRVRRGLFNYFCP